MYVYIYIYIHIHKNIYIYIYIYTYGGQVGPGYRRSALTRLQRGARPDPGQLAGRASVQTWAGACRFCDGSAVAASEVGFAFGKSYLSYLPPFLSSYLPISYPSLSPCFPLPLPPMPPNLCFRGYSSTYPCSIPLHSCL